MPVNNTSVAGVKDQGTLGGMLTRAVVGFERACAGHPTLAALYDRLFYRRLVEGEVRMAGLAPNSRILHVGCGRYPFTAMILAGLGHRVVGIDNDAAAVERARRIVEDRGLSRRIEIRHGDGTEIDTAGFDGVWVSFHAVPRKEIFENCLRNLPSRAPVIGRIPGGLGKLAYPGDFEINCECRKPFDAFKSTVLFRAGGESESTLSSVPTDGLVRIVEGEHCHPHLEPLGLRGGKEVRVCARMPFGGAMVIEVAGRKIALGNEVAARIRVATGDSN